ncbi:perforin-like protein 2 [Plasmodium sp. gorilla clade G3]|nr:perforin-like protein 2 [Plasmodium sp. gorilla clade G3]
MKILLKFHLSYIFFFVHFIVIYIKCKKINNNLDNDEKDGINNLEEHNPFDILKKKNSNNIENHSSKINKTFIKKHYSYSLLDNSLYDNNYESNFFPQKKNNKIDEEKYKGKHGTNFSIINKHMNEINNDKLGQDEILSNELNTKKEIIKEEHTKNNKFNNRSFDINKGNEKEIFLHNTFPENKEMNKIKMNSKFIEEKELNSTGKNYFENDKFIKIEYPIKNKDIDEYEEGINRNHKEENNKNITYHSNGKDTIKSLNFIKYIMNMDKGKKKGKKIYKRKKNENDYNYNYNYNINDSDLIDVLKKGDYSPDCDTCNKNMNDNVYKGMTIRRRINNRDYYKDFSLSDALPINKTHYSMILKNDDDTIIKEKNENNVDNIITKGKRGENLKEVYNDKKYNYLSLKYLGLGYDIIMGNPEGDPTLNVDPGFRGPVLQINLKEISLNNYENNKNEQDHNDDNYAYDDKSSKERENNIHKNNEWMKPWVIPEHSCSQSKNVEEIRNLEQYKLELLSDVKVSSPSSFPYSFSASAEFKNALKKLKVENNVIFLMKIYCLRYYTGIPITTTSYKFSENFKNALNKLPKYFDGLKEDSKCSYEYYTNKLNSPECEENVNKWMLFFKLHGTHVAYEIYLGGKIIIKININKEEYNKMKENNINVKTFFNIYFHQMGLSSTFKKETQKILNKFRISKHIAILGGNPGLNVENTSFFEKWVHSINNNSMPIRTKLLPFSFFMEDKDMIQAYKDALIFYGLTYGLQLFDQEKYNHTIISVGEYLEKCTQKLYAGPPPGLLTCPIGTTLLMGFSINLDFYKHKYLSSTNGITLCQPMKESCSGNGFEKNYSDIRIFALCTNKPFDFITQVIQQGEAPKISATCPGELVILFGFALMKGIGSSSANKIDIYPCRTGQNSCEAVLQNNKFKQSMIYLACVDKTTNGLEYLQTYSKTKNLGDVISDKYKADGYLNFSCPENNTLVFGFSLEFHTNFQATRNNFLYCSKYTNMCEISGIGINTHLSFFRSDKHSLAIIALCRSHGANNLFASK